MSLHSDLSRKMNEKPSCNKNCRTFRASIPIKSLYRAAKSYLLVLFLLAISLFTISRFRYSDTNTTNFTANLLIGVRNFSSVFLSYFTFAGKLDTSEISDLSGRNTGNHGDLKESNTNSVEDQAKRKGLLKPTSCLKEHCFSVEGPGDYIVIGNSGSKSENRTDCSIKPSTTAQLNLPPGVTVYKAILYWSASHHYMYPATPFCYMNGNFVTPNMTKTFDIFGLSFYGAYSDVTHMIEGSGKITVMNRLYNNKHGVCWANSAYAAWTMVVIYEKQGLPPARINACFDDFVFTYPQGNYTSAVECLSPAVNSIGRTTVVAFEGDEYKYEFFLYHE